MVKQMGAPVLVVGSLNADLTVHVERFPRGGETISGSDLAVQPGGKSSNQAAAAALLGAEVLLVGAVGRDANAEFLLEQASGRGVDVTRVRRRGVAATGTAMILVDASGENVIVVSPGANASLSPEDVSDADLATSAAVVLALEVPLTTVVDVASRASEAGALVLLNASPIRPLPAELLRAVDVLVVNEIELDALLETRRPAWSEKLEALSAIGVRRAVVTLGKDGAAVLDADAPEAVRFVPSIPVDAVDTTGCGDAFMGALAAELAGGSTLADAAATGAAAGAWAARGFGAQSSYGTREQLDQLIRSAAAEAAS